MSTEGSSLRRGLGDGLDVLTSSPATAAQKSCEVEGNKKKISDARPAPNKSKIALPLLVQDNVLPAYTPNPMLIAGQKLLIINDLEYKNEAKDLKAAAKEARLCTEGEIIIQK